MKNNNKTAAAVPTPCPVQTGPQAEPQSFTETALWHEGMQMQIRAFTEWEAAHPTPITAPTVQDHCGEDFHEVLEAAMVAETVYSRAPEKGKQNHAAFNVATINRAAVFAFVNGLLLETFDKGIREGKRQAAQ